MTQSNNLISNERTVTEKELTQIKRDQVDRFKIRRCDGIVNEPSVVQPKGMIYLESKHAQTNRGWGYIDKTCSTGRPMTKAGNTGRSTAKDNGPENVTA